MQTAGPHFARYAETYIRHTKGRWAGKALTLEPWQQDFIDEMLSVDDNGRRVYREAVLGIPRKNGKSSLAAAVALYLVGPDGEPGAEVIVAAGSREQAAMVYDQARDYVDASPALSDWYLAERQAITVAESRGVLKRVSADGRLQHGLNPHGIVCDELHSFTTPRQEELWDALVTSTGAREQPLTLAITTAGHDRDTILGQLYKEAMELELEHRHDGLTIARDREAGFLFWWYSAPEGCSLDDEDTWMLANPASWVTPETLRRSLHSPTMSEAAFRRLHLNQWTKSRNAWLPDGCWDGNTQSGISPNPGSQIWVGVDVGITDDSTAVAHSWHQDEDQVGVKTHVWSAKEGSECHTFVPGGRVRLGPVEDYILDLARRYRVAGVFYDPRFFERSAQELSDAGLLLVPMEQNGKPMADAYQAFYQGARSGRVVHDGDPVLSAHVEATAAEQTDRGWKVRKMKSSSKIDACVAAVMSHHQAASSTGRSAYENKELTAV